MNTRYTIRRSQITPLTIADRCAGSPSMRFLTAERNPDAAVRIAGSADPIACPLPHWNLLLQCSCDEDRDDCRVQLRAVTCRDACWERRAYKNPHDARVMHMSLE